MYNLKTLKIKYLLLGLLSIFSCEWRVEDQPGYWVITFPQDGATCNEIVSVGIDASDPDGICGIEINVNDLKIDVPLSEILGKINDGPIEINLNTNDLPDGPIEVSVTMCDCNDNCTESPPISYTVDNTLSVPDTINITSAVYNDGGFNIEWEKSLDLDFYQYDLYHSPTENIDDTLKIFTTNDINKTSYFIESINSVPANPLIYNHFYVVVIDTFNYSAISEMYQTSPDPYPIQINITSINYDSDQMTITWEGSQDVDFLKYELYMGNDSTNSSLLRTITNQTTTQHQLNDFNPHIKNYFKIDVYDIFEQKTSGYYVSNNIQPIPDDIILDPINSFGNEFTITWSPYFEDDFKQYELYQSNDASMTDSILLFSSTNSSENSYISLDNNYEETYFFKVYMIDDWDYKVPSNIQSIDPEYYTFIHNTCTLEPSSFKIQSPQSIWRKRVVWSG